MGNPYQLVAEAGEPVARLAMDDEDRATLKRALDMWEDLAGVGGPPGMPTPPQYNVILTDERRRALAQLLAVARAVL